MAPFIKSLWRTPILGSFVVAVSLLFGGALKAIPVTEGGNHFLQLKGIMRIDSVSWVSVVDTNTNITYFRSEDEVFLESYMVEEVDLQGQRVLLMDLSTRETCWLTLHGNETLRNINGLSLGHKEIPTSVLEAEPETQPLKAFTSLNAEAQYKLYDPKFIPFLEASGIEVPKNLRRMASHRSDSAKSNVDPLSEEGTEYVGAQIQAIKPDVAEQESTNRLARLPLNGNASTAEELARMRGKL